MHALAQTESSSQEEGKAGMREGLGRLVSPAPALPAFPFPRHKNPSGTELPTGETTPRQDQAAWALRGGSEGRAALVWGSCGPVSSPDHIPWPQPTAGITFPVQEAALATLPSWEFSFPITLLPLREPCHPPGSHPQERKLFLLLPHSQVVPNTRNNNKPAIN